MERFCRLFQCLGRRVTTGQQEQKIREANGAAYVYIAQGCKMRQEANIKKRSKSRINEEEKFKDIRAKKNKLVSEMGTTGI